MKMKMKKKMNENENESLLIPAVQHDIYHRINFKNKIHLRLTQIIKGTFFMLYINFRFRSKTCESFRDTTNI